MIVYSIQFTINGKESPECVWLTSGDVCKDVFSILRNTGVNDQILISVKDVSKSAVRNLFTSDEMDKYED